MVGRAAWVSLTLLGLGGCNESLPNEPLPGGYTIQYGDRGKAWLQKPDGTLAHGALIKQLFKDDQHVLLITFAATLGGEVNGPRPLAGNCYVALFIEIDAERMRQVRLAEARRLAAKMELVEESDRGCMQGMPNS